MGRIIVKIASIFCILLSLLAWFPSIVFQLVSQWFLLTLPFSLIGFCFAMAIKSRVLIIANIVMFFSIPILIYGFYIWEWIEST
ncbi:hypothetical protein HB852_06365 [Listeria grandensis]|uniref:hypothetical protein n=1 Tax=Listeria grandensis TaxID=1494963 RepID=UPI001626F253|nr:hypothetical protein [Listeria grandensis]MBC1474234.1 hypothetical protein [Listeria grandensis]